LVYLFPFWYVAPRKIWQSWSKVVAVGHTGCAEDWSRFPNVRFQNASQAPKRRTVEARPRPRQLHPLHQLRQGVPQGQGHQEVRHQVQITVALGTEGPNSRRGLESITQSFSPNLAQDGWQTCRPAANFSVTKIQEENSIIQSPCFFELGEKFVAHLMPN
jgi:hypothetical protein